MAKKMMTMDGNQAAAYASYAFTEVAGIYPITPSSPMAENVDQWSAKGQKNIFGNEVKVVELQSEAGAAGTVHGSLQAGALTTTYTASQGLLLMIPNMYKIAGELLPCVFHVSARALASHALSIFGDHSDVMACRQTGFAMLSANSVQEVMDLGCVAHLTTIKSRVPFLHFFDGFRTSHEIQKIEVIDYEDLKQLTDLDAVKAFKERSLNPDSPVLRGTAQNPDIFFQAREACNGYYDAVPEICRSYMKEISKLTGRNYDLFNYYGAADAERIVIAMGSVCETAEEVIDYLTAKGEKVGLLKVRLYRPFSVKHFLDAIPKTVRKIAVLDRTKEPGSLGEPLYLDVCAAYSGVENKPVIVGGRYGLGSKDTYPEQILAVYDNLNQAEPKNNFTIGINDDVTHLSLPDAASVDVAPKGTISCKFWGLGADGTVGANKNSIKIIGDHTDMYAQAYFSYDSKKSGGITVSHLRFGHTPIRSTYLIKKADFLACHKASYINQYDMLADVKENGTFLLNTHWTDEEIMANLPANVKRHLAQKKIKFYVIDAVSLAKEIGLGGRINTIMQAAFFKLANVMNIDDAVSYMKEAIKKSYGKKGDDIVNMNNAAVDAGVQKVREIAVPADWANAQDTAKADKGSDTPAFVKDVVEVINNQEGDKLPVSAFKGREDGTFPQGTSKYEKRGIAIDVPEWIPENCIQCNQCSYVCPHAVIRPFLLTPEEKEKAPAGFVTKKGLKPYDNYEFKIQVTTLDCTGCGVCANTCPAKEKALVMKPLETQVEKEVPNWEYAISLPEKKNPMNKDTVKGSQFEVPYLEFSGACAGCGETPYAKLMTQLYGDRMMIANATGCSSIWAGSAPAMPYTTNQKGQGPAWANSLFEDNAEFGFGMYTACETARAAILEKVKDVIANAKNDEVKAAAQAWVDGFDDGENTRALSDALVKALEACDCDCENKKYILENKRDLIKRSQWILGGDGWAYDIGFGGLDHVLASGKDINVLVFDTEVYSNTGGQASKSTPIGAVAQFAASGKKVKKKDLGMIAMSYGYVYVAQVAMGANQAQTLKAFREAEKHKGPSIIIAYAPCINHGIKGGLSGAQIQEKKAVECGYWHLYRFNPALKEEGKNPFTLDSKEPTASFQDFLQTEVRYTSLQRAFPEEAKELFEAAEQAAKDRYQSYLAKANQ
ncbi:MAG: pyruvate:ferredoxin (flavodoxin) oxidoreductase [Clostridia bacterium]|nr:pyruvate:ferredoxin (flavodoxin) oxidoreductase [Clostridia bacterium]